jgi:hypothetical protein
MAISAGVGSATNSGTTSALGVTLAGCTANRHLVIRYAFEPGAGPAAFSSLLCSGETVVVPDSDLVISDTYSSHMRCAYIAQLAGGGSKTLTLNLTASAVCSMLVEEIQGADPASFRVAEISLTAAESDDGLYDVTGTTANANDGIFGAMMVAGSQESISGATLIAMNDTNRTMYGYSLYDAGAAGTKTFNITTNSFGDNWGSKALIVKAAGGGGGGSPDPIIVMAPMQPPRWR